MSDCVRIPIDSSSYFPIVHTSIPKELKGRIATHSLTHLSCEYAYLELASTHPCIWLLTSFGGTGAYSSPGSGLRLDQSFRSRV